VEDYLTEDDQWVALKQWLKDNGSWIVTGVVIGAVGLLGLTGGRIISIPAGQAGSAEYQAVVAALSKGDQAGASAAAGKLEHDYPHSPYQRPGVAGAGPHACGAS